MTTVGSGHRRCRSEIVTSLNTQNQGNGFQRLKTHMQRALNWGGTQEQAFFNPEILANQKRQWYQFHSRSSDDATYQNPTSLFEHFLIVGIHPNANLRPVEDAFARRKKWETIVDNTELMDLKIMQFRSPPYVIMEPQILFKYPPGKKLSMRLVDLASFCFPAGVKAHVLERTPSLSELNQLVYGQEHLSRDDLSFIFSLKVADNATLYGICLHTQEFVQRPPGMIGALSSVSRASGKSSRYLVTAPRCYCILTRVPFFELHYEMLNSIIAQERLNRITQFVSEVSLDHIPSAPKLNDQANECTGNQSEEQLWMESAIPVNKAIGLSAAAAAGIIVDELNSPRFTIESPNSVALSGKNHNKENQTENVGRKELPSPNDSNSDVLDKRWECLGKMHGDLDSIRKADVEACVFPVSRAVERLGSSGPLFRDLGAVSLPLTESKRRCLPNTRKPLIRPILLTNPPMLVKVKLKSYLVKSSVRGIVLDDEDAVLSCSDSEATTKSIMEWARENKNDLLQIVCGYHALPVPSYGGKLIFKPLEHLPSIEYYRTTFAFGADIDISQIPDKVKFKLAAIEEAVSLSNWTTATICGVLSLQNVLILLAAVLLEKQVIITSPNLGVLSATVLSLIPMILPFEWQSLFLPVLPGKMFDFLDAPVPFVVGILHEPTDKKMRASNLVHVDLANNQVEMSSLPALPKQRELITKLGPLHTRLCDKSSSRKHPVYRCNKWQIEIAAQFLNVMRQHLESLCSNLSSHAITNVQSDDDRVSLLLKESYIDSFPARDRPFIRQFVDTQMFTVLSDTRLSRPDA